MMKICLFSTFVIMINYWISLKNLFFICYVHMKIKIKDAKILNSISIYVFKIFKKLLVHIIKVTIQNRYCHIEGSRMN